jgi:hypothetical protein
MLHSEVMRTVHKSNPEHVACRSTCVLRGAGGFSAKSSSPSTSGRDGGPTNKSAKASRAGSSTKPDLHRTPDFMHEEQTAPGQVRSAICFTTFSLEILFVEATGRMGLQVNHRSKDPNGSMLTTESPRGS